MFGVVDRFEGDFAVVEMDSGEIINIQKFKIPYETAEGDVLEINNKHKCIRNIEETEKRRREIEELTKDIWNE